MSTHNICFHREIRKISTLFSQKKKKVTYLKLCMRGQVRNSIDINVGPVKTQIIGTV